MDGVFDALVIGGGAAGLSAALTLGRSCRSVLVFDDGRPRNRVAARMHGFLTRDGTHPGELLEMARKEACAYPSVQLHASHVAQARRDGECFRVEAESGETFAGRAILLATGVYDALPSIDGIAELWGRRVFVCPYCDAWEVRGQRLAIFGKTPRVIELAQELHQWSDDLVICVDGAFEVSAEQRRWIDRAGAAVRQERVTHLSEGRDGVQLEFDDGVPEKAAAMFLCAPLRQRYPLVEMLGCTLDGDGNIEIDQGGRTRAVGVYAAGDCVSNVHQVILAAASGVCAAMSLNNDLLSADIRRLSS